RGFLRRVAPCRHKPFAAVHAASSLHPRNALKSPARPVEPHSRHFACRPPARASTANLDGKEGVLPTASPPRRHAPASSHHSQAHHAQPPKQGFARVSHGVS